MLFKRYESTEVDLQIKKAAHVKSQFIAQREWRCFTGSVLGSND